MILLRVSADQNSFSCSSGDLLFLQNPESDQMRTESIDGSSGTIEHVSCFDFNDKKSQKSNPHPIPEENNSLLAKKENMKCKNLTNIFNSCIKNAFQVRFLQNNRLFKDPS
jgi:hypothetical protein